MLGIDPATVDPRVILASIAADTSAPATARVAACRALLADVDESEPLRSAKPAAQADALTERALEIMSRDRRPN
jgi:hypothetical protein